MARRYPAGTSVALRAMDSPPAEPPQEQALDPVEDLPEQMRVRREKRERLLASGIEPYALGHPRTHTLAEVRRAWPDLAAGTETGEIVSVVGRVLLARNAGKLCFATLRAGDGTELQVMLSLDRIGEAALAAWKSDVDLGDHVGVTGEVISSRRGELSVLADRWALTSKALRPLPVAHKPLSEETRVRQRYIDLVLRPEARSMARLRPAVVRSLRQSLDARGFIEVETPMLQTLQGGAAARPFVTHTNAFDLDVFLRIAPELFLKRCVVGGIERAFEINRNFRNEGADSTHSPEFAMLEFYAAYEDYDSVADITRALVQEAAVSTTGSTTVTHVDGSEFDLGGQWARISMFPAVSAAVEEEVTPQTPIERLRALAAAAGIVHDPGAIHGKLVEELFEHYVVDTFTGPTFVIDFPVDTSPLVRQHRSFPGVVEKWDLYVAGFELGTGYTELVDPVVQRQRFEEQALLAAGGDLEAMPLDEDFLRAMEYGMPPMGGVGMGIDRLLMALTGVTSIRETMLFPLVKPES
jgi:lysyl-tRNA synthetase, class II